MAPDEGLLGMCGGLPIAISEAVVHVSAVPDGYDDDLQTVFL
jgi:hypothetical protein